MARRLAVVGLGMVLLVVVPASNASAARAVPPSDWNLAAIRAHDGWDLARGRGQVVAIIDSGVDLANPDLAGRLVAGHDFVDDDDVPMDLDGHGTHVAGVVAEVAPEARIMPLRVLDAGGRGGVDDAVAAVHWAVAHGATVLNLSFGGGGGDLAGPSVTEALLSAWRAGVVPVLASADGGRSPQGFEGLPIVIVTATTSAGDHAAYATAVGDARWPMAAPGGDVLGGGVVTTAPGGGRSALIGTSMAAPHVAAAIALLRSAGLAPHDAVIRLLTTARDLGAPGRDPYFGSGEIDLGAAVADLVDPRPVIMAAPAGARIDGSWGEGDVDRETLRTAMLLAAVLSLLVVGLRAAASTWGVRLPRYGRA